MSCGVKYNVLGKENIDLNRNGIVLANHQSTWETLIIPTLFPTISWVLKKELFKIVDNRQRLLAVIKKDEKTDHYTYCCVLAEPS